MIKFKNKRFVHSHVGNEFTSSQVGIERIQSYASLKRENKRLREERGALALILILMTLLMIAMWFALVNSRDEIILEHESTFSNVKPTYHALSYKSIPHKKYAVKVNGGE